MNDSNDLYDFIEGLKTDDAELDELLEEHDLDAALLTEFNAIDTEFNDWKTDYKSVLRTRKNG